MIKIREILSEEVKKLSLEVEGVDFEQPKNITNGDFSLFLQDSEIKVDKLPLKKIHHEYIERVEVIGRFLNLYLSKKFFVDSLADILENQDHFGHNKNLDGKKIIIEYTNPNPFKELHIGHLMSNTIGESLSRIIGAGGAVITRANYQGDVGLQVAKAIWGMLKLKEIPAENQSLHKKITFIGLAYVEGSRAYESDDVLKKEIDRLNIDIYEKTNFEANRLYDWGRKVSLDHFEEMYKKLGTRFDLYFFESETAPLGLLAVEALLAKGVLEKSDGAIIFKGEQYGLHTRVFVNSQGLPTYEAKELGLTKMKFDRQDFDQSIVLTANEQNDYFLVVLKVLEFVDHRAANRTMHISNGMLRFAHEKMSSRKGNVIAAETLINDIERLVKEKIKDRELSKEEKDAIVEQVAVGAIKYSILKQSPGKDIIFDFNKSLSFEGDSGPYVQYTHARICSMLRKAEREGMTESLENPEDQGELEHLIVRFPEIVERAQKEFAPQLITTYITNLASVFNHYYAENVIVDSAKKESAYRIALARSVKIILKNGLTLLGIKAPDKM